MRNEYNSFVELKAKSGVSYDPTRQTIIASNEYWKEVLSKPKDSKKFKAFRDRGLKWDYEKLSTVIGNSHATGSYSVNGLDEDTEKNGEEDSIDLEIGEKQSLPQAPRRKNDNMGKE
ncbi:hypothetical protein AQUCO_08100014v1 [Aquilegia coerulea]|uniref:Myb/SANT-like domain-containing protein n=1 Tax=Aquilegia coerulea TaxID=218851 RepID=A0A2G5C7M2_AQUCA|nr:hypothetical protein AQUCO_08100014v1 [Aquilegia coerulea]